VYGEWVSAFKTAGAPFVLTSREYARAGHGLRESAEHATRRIASDLGGAFRDEESMRSGFVEVVEPTVPLLHCHEVDVEGNVRVLDIVCSTT
jgi:hypothetical protein